MIFDDENILQYPELYSSGGPVYTEVICTCALYKHCYKSNGPQIVACPYSAHSLQYPEFDSSCGPVYTQGSYAPSSNTSLASGQIVTSSAVLDDTIHLDNQYRHLVSWFSHKRLLVGVPLTMPSPTVEIFTDAPKTGWGASWGDRALAGTWTSQQSQVHINFLELQAVELALQQWQDLLQDTVIRLFCNNSTTVSYLRKGGGDTI